MTRVQAIVRLEGLIQGHWNTIASIKARKDLTKAEIREWSSRHKLDIEALQLARDALKNPSYQGKGVALETGIDDPTCPLGCGSDECRQPQPCQEGKRYHG